MVKKVLSDELTRLLMELGFSMADYIIDKTGSSNITKNPHVLYAAGVAFGAETIFKALRMMGQDKTADELETLLITPKNKYMN